MKKILQVCGLCFTLLLVGCGAEEEEVEKDPTIEIVENSLYASPKDPSTYQTKTFNELSEALTDNEDGEMIATLVAKNFCADFYTLKNKESANDVGGLTYIPEAYQEEFKNYAAAYVYTQYTSIEEEHGNKHLFEVTEVSVETIQEETFLYNKYVDVTQSDTGAAYYEEVVVEGFQMDISLVYKDTDVSESDMKMNATIQIMLLDGKYVVLAVE